MTLRAKAPVLYASRQYRVGDALPGADEQLVAAWLETGVAYWDEVDVHTPAPKARPASDQGMPGKSSDGDPEAKVGKVPQRVPPREAPPAKGARKKK